MQNAHETFRLKVFDEEVMNYSLSLLDLTEKMGRDPAFIRRAVMDALVMHSSLAEASEFLKTLNAICLEDFLPQAEAFLDICVEAHNQKKNNQEFFATVRLLGNCSEFRDWNSFFTTSKAYNATSETDISKDLFLTVRHLGTSTAFSNWNSFFAASKAFKTAAETDVSTDFLLTVRHLANIPEFREWEAFLTASKVLQNSTNLEISSDFFMTVRHLASATEFLDWNSFFSSFKVLHAASVSNSCFDFLTTVRHLVSLKSFKDWPGFFTALKTLTEHDGNPIPEFLEAVRHAINYFSSSDSLLSLFKMLSANPQYTEACSYGQLDSKKWLIDESRKVWGDEWGRVFVLAGWVGFLPRFIFDSGIQTTAVRSFDIDPEAGGAAEQLNQSLVQKDWLFKSSTLDITQMQYPTTFQVQRKDHSLCELHETPDMVINTSCEHIADIGSWWAAIPKGMRVILQSNDGFHIAEHVRCFKSLKDFQEAMNLTRVDFKGEKRLADFNRFMLIGVK